MQDFLGRTVEVGDYLIGAHCVNNISARIAKLKIWKVVYDFDDTTILLINPNIPFTEIDYLTGAIEKDCERAHSENYYRISEADAMLYKLQE